MTAYYNEIDPYAAQWLRNLIAAGHIADGEVDERDIRDVRPDELAGFDQCHFFAGIGVWSHALRGAGWPDDRPVWTGSCPCQPFSAAGRRGGTADERHLWPHWFHLIEQCRPPVIFGEQVSSADVLGKSGVLELRSREAYWRLLENGMEGDVSDHLQDMQERFRSGWRPPSEIVDGFEGEPFGSWGEVSSREQGVAFRSDGEVDQGQIGSRGVRDDRRPVRHGAGAAVGDAVAGQDKSRRRLHAGEHEDGHLRGQYSDGRVGAGSCEDGGSRAPEHTNSALERPDAEPGGNPKEEVRNVWFDSLRIDMERAHYTVGACDLPAAGFGAPHIRQRLYFVADADADDAGLEGRLGVQERPDQRAAGPDGMAGWVAQPHGGERDGRPVSTRGHDSHGQDAGWPESDGGAAGRGEADRPGPTNGFWRDADWLLCRDPDGARWRPVEPGTFPLAHGTPSGMGSMCPELRRMAELAGLDGVSLKRAKAYRTGTIKGFGNAIVAPQAQEFVEAYLAIEDEQSKTVGESA